MTKLFAVFFSLLLLLPNLSRAEAEPEPAKKVDLSMLTTEEVEVYQYGKISDSSLIAGGLIGTFFGLGTGHIVEGQYLKRGWIFTAGELGSIALVTVGLASQVDTDLNCAFSGNSKCSNNSTNGLIVAGLVGYFGFRIWELVDVWTTPGRVNSEYDAIKARVESGAPKKRAEMMLAPMVFAADRNSKSPVGVEMLVRF